MLCCAERPLAAQGCNVWRQCNMLLSALQRMARLQRVALRALQHAACARHRWAAAAARERGAQPGVCTLKVGLRGHVPEGMSGHVPEGMNGHVPEGEWARQRSCVRLLVGVQSAREVSSSTSTDRIAATDRTNTSGLRAADSMQHATDSMQHATCNRQRATL